VALESVIALTGVKRRYRMGDHEVEALRGVDLRILEGEYVSIMGPSGSGKSTLMNVVGCMDRPTEGSYELEGASVEALDEDALAAVRSRRIGFVFQQFNLIPRATALENVELPLFYQRVAESRRRALEALERVGLARRADHFPNQLSGGEMQRVAIARAIVTRPAILLADEPTGNLDSANGEEVLKLFESMRAEVRTMIVVTHDAAVGRRADRTVRMRDGRVEG
jgi:putative ABC transport system ATP-binding protein